VIMGQVILPITPLPNGPFSLSNSIIGWITLGVVLGIPIAYNAYKYYKVDSREEAGLIKIST
jgi:hypothetical protein